MNTNDQKATGPNNIIMYKLKAPVIIRKISINFG